MGGEEFDEIERPATMLRSDLLREADALPEYVSPLTADAPELGESGQRTMLRSMPKRQAPVIPATADTAVSSGKRQWFTKKNIILGSTGLVLVAGLGVGTIWLVTSDRAQTGPAASASEALEVSQQDPPLPSGLSVSRKASYDPTTQQVSLELTYTAQKAPLTGSFLEVVPGVGTGPACPAVVWDGAEGAKHQASSTGLRANCGWKLDGIEVPANRQATVTASFSATIADAAELTEWLNEAAAATTEALNKPETISTAYPAQRIRDINITTPARTVSQTPLTVTLVPVWPSGPDELNPLYQSPSTGAPSQMLQAIAGGEDGIRFSDGCSGAVAISTDGLVATALSVTSECRLYANVGNFTNLQSSPFSITTRE